MANDLYTLKQDDRGGIMSTINFTKTAIAKPYVLAGDKLLRVDIYPKIGDEFFINLYCPRCLNSLKISSKRKKIEWDENHGLSVEPFRCTWELSDRPGERIDFGLGMCNWSAAIDPCNRPMDTSEGKITIHGIAKEV